MNLKIIYLCGDLSQIGGIEKYNRDFISALLSHGNRVKVIERRRGGLLSKVRLVIDFLIAMMRFQPNYLICAHLNFSPLALILNKSIKLRYSLTLYGVEVIQSNKLVHREAVSRAERLIVISEYTRQLLTKYLNPDQEKIFILPSCVEDGLYSLIPRGEEIRRKYGFKDKKIVLTLSRLSSHEEKGQHRVLKAMTDVVEKFPNVVYVVAGPGSDERIEQVLKDQPDLSKNLIIMGPVTESQKRDLYNLCDVFILVSKDEGFGIVFIEALACGARVVASDGYGCREGLLNGRLGRLVDPDDTKSISQVIINMLSRGLEDDEELRIFLREESLKIYGKEHFYRKIRFFFESI